MASSEPTEHLVFQEFKAKDGSPLTSLGSHLCAETDERYLLWTEIHHKFNGIGHLETEWKTRVPFTINADGELYVLLFAKHLV